MTRVEFIVLKHDESADGAKVLFQDIFNYESLIARRAIAAHVKHYLAMRDPSIDIVTTFVV